MLLLLMGVRFIAIQEAQTIISELKKIHIFKKNQSTICLLLQYGRQYHTGMFFYLCFFDSSAIQHMFENVERLFSAAT
jgi:hypothetical protein